MKEKKNNKGGSSGDSVFLIGENFFDTECRNFLIMTFYGSSINHLTNGRSEQNLISRFSLPKRNPAESTERKFWKRNLFSFRISFRFRFPTAAVAVWILSLTKKRLHFKAASNPQNHVKSTPEKITQEFYDWLFFCQALPRQIMYLRKLFF